MRRAPSLPHRMRTGLERGCPLLCPQFMVIGMLKKPSQHFRVSKERGRVIDFKEVLYGYIRWHPSLASEYILDMLLLYKKFRGKKMTVPVRRHAYMQVPLGPLYVQEIEQEQLLEPASPTSAIQELVEVVVKSSLKDLGKLSYKVPSGEPSISQKPKKIHFILPLAGRLKIFQRFMENFRSACLEREENVALVVVSFQPPPGEEDTRDHVEALISSLHLDYPEADMTVLQANTTFSRAMALELGANLCKESDLMFFIDVDMTFTSATLDRVRLHTKERLQIYYPIVFSEFDPDFSRDGKIDGYDHSLLQTTLISMLSLSSTMICLTSKGPSPLCLWPPSSTSTLPCTSAPLPTSTTSSSTSTLVSSPMPSIPPVVAPSLAKGLTYSIPHSPLLLPWSSTCTPIVSSSLLPFATPSDAHPAAPPPPINGTSASGSICSPYILHVTYSFDLI
ncbi:Chondroitin sulfate synthase 1 [Portunus trituberculatus]|uniref:Hexosyltransferase n=1 Tax=Portunus trituberculatus TaxID=210409 RepID=A0A5B7EDA4_PORTR|nr:Chondroitin sulfate synthase 1 [Portunus trituberculatus]